MHGQVRTDELTLRSGRRGRSSQRARRLVGAVLGVVVLGALLAACGTTGDEAGQPGTAGNGGVGADPPGAPTAGNPTVSAPPILVVEEEGGFVAPGVLFDRLPTAYVTGDGRVITQGPVIAIYPGPALPNLRQRTLDRAALETLRTLAADAEVDQPPPDYGQPNIADASTTVVTYRAADGRTYVHRAYALAITERAHGLVPAEPGDGITGEQRAARQRLAAFVGAVTDPGQVGGPGAPDDPFTPAAFVVQARAADPEPATPATAPSPPASPAPGPTPTVTAWPIASVRLDQSASCTPVTGPDATTLLEALRVANQLTQWSQDGHTYTVSVRPALPGDGLCR